MFRDVVILNGPVPKDGVADYERLRVKARPLGRPYVWDNGRAWNSYTTNGGFVLVFEAEDGAIYIQEIEWEVDPIRTRRLTRGRTTIMNATPRSPTRGRAGAGG